MKNFIFICILTLCIKVSALNIVNVWQLPNVSTPGGTNWLIMFSQPGVTNYQMSVLQFETWLANDPIFINLLLANTNLHFNATSTNFTTQTYGSSYVFTNTISYWATNSSFVSSATYSVSPFFQSELVISNTSITTKITNTLPWTGYSLSLGTNVTQAVVQSNSVLDIKVNYYNGIYYIQDYGKNNSSLVSAASLVGQGSVFFTNGTFFVH